MSRGVLFVGGARYGWPLDMTSESKFRQLAEFDEIHVLGFSHDKRPRFFSRHAQFYLLPQLPFPVLRYAMMLTVGLGVALVTVMRTGVHVIVAQSPYEGAAAAMTKLLARWLGRRVALVIESHGDFEEALFGYRRIPWPGLVRRAMRATAAFAFRHADALRAISDSTRKQLEAWAPDLPVVQFPAWTDLGLFVKAGGRRVAASDEILYAGVLVPLKGVHYLLEALVLAVTKGADAKLRIVGRCAHRAYGEGLRQQVKRLGLEARVTFVDEVPQPDLAEYMARAAVFVLPSTTEGLGRVVIEAMATGTPVIASRVGGLPEIVLDGETGFLVPPGDVAALADRLAWCFAHPAKAEAMGARGRAWAGHLFSTEVYVQGYAALLAQAEQRCARSCR